MTSPQDLLGGSIDIDVENGSASEVSELIRLGLGLGFVVVGSLLTFYCKPLRTHDSTLD